MSTAQPHGLHHVTAVAEAPQRNVDFYCRVLGLRLVKQTVNFDAPGAYHLYYGDGAGRPSSLITFFAWRDVPRGRLGTGLATATAFSIPEGSASWWRDHLRAQGVEADVTTRHGADVVAFRDPDGMVLELVTAAGDTRSGWDGVAGVPAEHALRGLHAVTLTERALDPTAEVLTSLLGMGLDGEDGGRARFAMGDGGSGALVDVHGTTSAERGLQAGGTVHHVAFRAPDETALARWRQGLVDAGLEATEVLDRKYFRSVYFREPGGVLFEIATDAPGFDVDEPLLELGRRLQLPPWLEPDREQIAAALPPLHVPDDQDAGLVPTD
ncbi:glyoxalase family protein [Kineococcus xinjiangensis]|uniref:Glyoxalase family protein n=1 Tax=Kineococcus xinjiangensis TaxID=512762 RepID=A0A2S6IUI2_9ACTN|nr:ring-cleaving dioxygenase [Kineococcus xinjiangensis]PPK97935.1 glyoxalase family protein [Kineococcus xinjiangensis]